MAEALKDAVASMTEMVFDRWRPRLCADFIACARRSALDLAASVLLFVGSSIAAGRVWRFPFDDELIALSPIENAHSAFELVTFYLRGGDIHPPLSFLLFYAAQHLGFSESAMRLCSLAMTALALALFHVTALTLLERREREAVSTTDRLIAVLLFGLCPLAIGQGDAIRWYPLFAMLVSLFVALYLFGANGATRLWSAVPLGLAASTNFIAIIVVVPFALYRYGLQRRFHVGFDAVFALVVLLFASLGFVSAYSVFTKRFGGVMHTEFGHGVIQAAAANVLGFFGGDALGIGYAWAIVPVVAMFVMAVLSTVDRKQADNPAHLLLLMLAASALMVLGGFSKPRSFLYLAPAVAVVLTLFFGRQARIRNASVAVLLVSLTLTASVAAVANINGGTRPFKRNIVIPYQTILDFIATNTTGSVLVVSTDPIIPWVLRHRHDRADRCVSYFLDERACFAADRRYDSIAIIVGYNNRSANTAYTQRFLASTGDLTSGRHKVATLHAGIDDDSDLKTRLTGVPLEKSILTIDLYQ